MSDNKVLGWCSLGLFAIAVLILAYIAALLIFFPNAAFSANVNAQVLFVVSGLLGLIAAVLGFLSRRTAQGKIGGIGGLVLSIGMATVLSLTLTTSVVRQEGAVQLNPIAYALRSNL